MTRLKIKENIPAPKPLIKTISSGSFAETLRVKLLSSPQKMQAPMIPREPREKPHAPPLKDKMILARVINTKLNHTLRLMYSLRNNPAISAVATLSKLSNKEAVEAGVFYSG